MTGAGYAKDSKGIWAKGGTEVSFKIEDPTAYTDYYQASQIMSATFKSLGFNATPDGVDPNKWYADLAAGTFDTAIHWSNTGPSPYATYEGWLDPALSTGPSQQRQRQLRPASTTLTRLRRLPRTPRPAPRLSPRPRSTCSPRS